MKSCLHEVPRDLSGLATTSVPGYQDDLMGAHGINNVWPVLVDGKVFLVTSNLHQLLKLNMDSRKGRGEERRTRESSEVKHGEKGSDMVRRRSQEKTRAQYQFSN